LPSQELADKVAEELPPEETDCILESHQEYPNCPSEAFQDPPTHIAGLDLQAVLMALARQPNSQPKKRSKRGQGTRPV